jgi:hypothetical protein
MVFYISRKRLEEFEYIISQVCSCVYLFLCHDIAWESFDFSGTRLLFQGNSIKSFANMYLGYALMYILTSLSLNEI